MAYAVSKTFKSLRHPDLTIAHPKEFAWIVKSNKKIDRVDSLKLAKLRRMSSLPGSHLIEL